MFKNVAGQHIMFVAYDTTTGLLKTGDAGNLTAYQSIDSASPPTALADASATEISATLAKGAYVFDLAQAETNGDMILYTCNSTTGGIQLDPVLVFTQPQTVTVGQISTGIYERGAVWVDTTSGVNGTTQWVHGINTNPTSSIANVTTLLASTGLRNVYVNERSSIVLDAAHTNQEFFGSEWTLDLNGKNIGNTRFNGCTVSGASTGSGWTLTDAHVNVVTMAPGDINDSDMQDVFTCQAAGSYSIHHSRGANQFVVDFAAVGATLVDLDDFSGIVEVRNMGAGDEFHCAGTGGAITLAASCTGGLVHLHGPFNLTNNGTGQTLNDNSRWSWDYPVAGTTGFINAVRGFIAALLGKASGLDLGTPKYRNIADSKNVIDAVTDANGNRSVVTLDLT